METCSICLDALDGGAVALACGHRFHAACLARLAGATGTSSTRRGALTACPNCRTTSRVAAYKPAAYDVGDRVSALWGYKWYPGVVDEVIEGGTSYKIAWDDGEEGEVTAAHVRAEQLTVDVDTPTERDASPPAVVTPRAAPPVEPLSPARPPLLTPPPRKRNKTEKGQHYHDHDAEVEDRICRQEMAQKPLERAATAPPRVGRPEQAPPCGTTPSFNADAALRGGRCRNNPCGGECPTEPSFNADVVKRLACGRTALACCAPNGERPECYVKLDTIVLTSAKAEAAWDSLTPLKRRRAMKLELAGEWMIDHGVRKLYLHRECYRVFENLRLQGPLASVTVIDTNPAPAVDVAP